MKMILKYFFMVVGVIVCIPLIFKTLGLLIGTAFGIMGFLIKGAVYAGFFWVVFKIFKYNLGKDEKINTIKQNDEI